MIPVSLKLSGFLSYRDPVELDFTGFDLACISGSNGAGKSSLLDAITWALFGQARKQGEALINLASNAAEVAFVFRYEDMLYRIQRSLPRGKSTLLEFQIQENSQGIWRALTEKNTRETQARIEHILRLDYDTFVNASFFLQGKADQFTQQKAAERKRILSSILSLEIWETYKERAAERRKTLERDLDSIDGRIEEINRELDEEPARKTRLAELEKQVEQLSAARKTQEAALENIKRVAATLNEQRRLVDTLRTQHDRAATDQTTRERRLADREAERAALADLSARTAEINLAYKTWLVYRAALADLDKTAATFHEHEQRRAPFVEQITAEKARLEQEMSVLGEQSLAISEQAAAVINLKKEIEVVKDQLQETEAQIAQREAARAKLDSLREDAAARRAENDALKVQMDETKSRIDRMGAIEGATCPLCGQPLSEAHRAETLNQLNATGKEMGDRWRDNKKRIDELAKEIKALEAQVSGQANIELERVARASLLSTLTERLDTLHKAEAEWKEKGRKRLKEVEKLLESGKFLPEVQKELAAVDKELKKLGYDAAAHDAARQAEVAGRSAEADFRALEKAQAALAPIEREIAEIKSQNAKAQEEIDNRKSEFETAAARLAEAEARAPDVDAAERAMLNLREQENILQREVGAARQNVEVLTTLKARKQRLETEREDLARQTAHLKTLERAFGKDGVPALLIEQALPEIESKANELLDRLSNGAMSVRFVTQAEYKDKKRDDLKETLDIQISDGAGLRDYEMFSGGEAFRVNFAIRLALSKVLAQRTGARLQTLVIDEGFGSQDMQGRQRLIEAINLVKNDFAKILVITHIDELKDAFPNRIEVEKTPGGSSIRVL